MSNKNIVSSYDRLIQKMTAKQKKKFDEEYQELVLSELLLACAHDDISAARALAKEAGLSSAIVQGVRSGTKQNITLQSFLKMMQALGCSIVIKKNRHSYPLELVQ